MKVLLTNYIFTPSTSTIKFPANYLINPSGMLLITNTTAGVIIYNFSDGANNGTFNAATNTLTLDYNTSAMAATDNLQIYYDDGATVPVELSGERGNVSSSTHDKEVHDILGQILEEAQEIKMLLITIFQ